MGEVADNEGEHRFELVEDGQQAELVYRLSDGRLVLVHTGVPDDLGGQGIAGRLVQASVDRAAEDGLTLVPQCSYARTWLQEHPDAVGDVHIDWPT
jgi:hypothetical protein